MKKIALGILALTLAFPAVYAQEKTNKEVNKESGAYRHHPAKHKRQHHAGYKKLNLTKEQQDQLAVINKNYRSGIADLKKKEATITVKDYKAQMQALNKKRRGEADKVFTKEQKEQLQQMRTGKKGKFTAGNRSQQMKTTLGLTDDQSDRMKALREYTQKKIKDVRENAALTDTQKKEQLAAIFKQQREDVKLILTPEQVKKMKDLRSRRINRTSK
jgi:Spy/CpxP family protein refolding chaperone